MLVTFRARGTGSGVPSLRSQLGMRIVRKVVEKQKRRAYKDGFQIVEHSLQKDHLHLIVEGTDKTSDAAATSALRSGIAGFATSFARRLNNALGRRGKVWADRHHRRDITTPTEMRSVLAYVLLNHKKHGHRIPMEDAVDPYSSASSFEGWTKPVVARSETEPWPRPPPRTWMLRVGWIERGGGLLDPNEEPAAVRAQREKAARHARRATRRNALPPRLRV